VGEEEAGQYVARVRLKLTLPMAGRKFRWCCGCGVGTSRQTMHLTELPSSRSSRWNRDERGTNLGSAKV